MGFGDVGLLITNSGLGKRLNIRIYTVYIPEKVGISEQYRRTLSIKNEEDLKVVDFEEMVRESIVNALQCIVNNNGGAGSSSENSNENGHIEF